jgi:uncharacterized lipoprotein YddW (UPF0748 family)
MRRGEMKMTECKRITRQILKCFLGLTLILTFFQLLATNAYCVSNNPSLVNTIADSQNPEDNDWKVMFEPGIPDVNPSQTEVSLRSFRADGTTDKPEIRAIWVDAFHDGIKTQAQVDKLVADCKRANINTLIVQVRRRGDAYYNISTEPRTEDPGLTPGFDALQYLIEKAHANQLEVHAWLNTLVAWYKTTPPQDPNHVWNLHGPNAVGEENWVSYYRKYDSTAKTWSNEICSSYYLDPGNPDALDYTAEVYLNVVRNYDVDGIHLDYSRYCDKNYGYNLTSVARFNTCNGTTGLPLPNDPKWLEWRREQTANLMRKIYLKAIAIKPRLKVSSAVIAWGAGPVAEGDWVYSSAYSDLGQDWRSWVEQGIIDLAFPMNYDKEWVANQKLWYNQWIEWEKNHQYNRQIVIGPGIYLNYIEQSLDQIRRAQTPSALGNCAAGVALYSYGSSNLYSNDDYASGTNSQSLPRQPYVYNPGTNDWLYSLLSSPGNYIDPVLQTSITTEPVFSLPSSVPDMPWKSNPTKGYLMGTVAGVAGKTTDRLKVIVESVNPNDLNVRREAYTDGSGWYGLTELPPGQYRVTVDDQDFTGKVYNVTISPGVVAEANL